MLNLQNEIINLQNHHAKTKVIAKTIFKKNDRLVIDIYKLDGSKHPDEHLGWWLFLFKRNLQGEIYFNFSNINENSVQILENSKLRIADDCWFNEEYLFSPVQDLHLLIRDRKNKPIEKITYQLIDASTTVLKRFYDNLHATDGYKTEGNTFLITLHHHKLDILKEIFKSVIPVRSKVLDVGCGNSLFTEIDVEWNFSLTCCDIGEPVIKNRKSLYPEYRWLISDVSFLPFPDEHFDALFAGEIIEHVPDVTKTVSEWKRVLKPKGIVIITTPNRRRLRNWVNHSQRPLGADHLNELTFQELEVYLENNGFEILQRHGFYLELFLNWFKRGTKIDYLQAGGNVNKNIVKMNILNKLGHFFPRLAFGLIFVAKKS